MARHRPGAHVADRFPQGAGDYVAAGEIACAALARALSLGGEAAGEPVRALPAT